MAAAAPSVFVTVATATTTFAGALMLALLAGAVAMPVAPIATIATFLRIAHAASRRDDGGFKLSVLEQGDRLRRCLRFGTIDLDALLDQSSQSDTIDAAAKVRREFPYRQQNPPVDHVALCPHTSGFRCRKKQVFGARQMGLEKRLEALRSINRNAKFH